MYLSRVKINNHIRTSIRFLSSLQVMHATLEGCFDQKDSTRKLWRLDYLHGEPYLLVFSHSKPDFTPLIQQFGYAGDTGEIKECDGLLAYLDNGQCYRFRFCGNPVHAVKEKGSKSRGKVMPHVTVAQQEEWFQKKSECAGFSLETFALVQRNIRRFTRQGKSVTLHTAVFEGVLRITDADLFRQALCTGIGRAKAYGCGLLTLGRL